MAASITHSTLADVTFSAAGQAAWDAEHSVSGLIPINNTQNIDGAAELATFVLGDVNNTVVNPSWNSGVNYVTKIYNVEATTALSMKTDSNDGVPLMVSNNSVESITLTPITGTINGEATLDIPTDTWITVIFNNGNAYIVDASDITLLNGYVAPSGGGTIYFPFYKADGNADSIGLISGTSLPFYDASGATKNIALVTV